MEVMDIFFPLSVSLILILISSVLIWYYVKDKFTYWSKRGVPCIGLVKSCIQTLQSVCGQIMLVDLHNNRYKEFTEHKYVGFFELAQPSLLIRDPKLIESVLVNNFSSFHDRKLGPNEEYDEFADSIGLLNGEKWRQMRYKVSPAFSSAKMKIMHENLRDCAQELNTYLQKLCSNLEETEIEVKEIMFSYTLDVIGACAMGIKCNSIQDPNCEFKRVMHKIFAVRLRGSIYMLLELIHPKFRQFLRWKWMDPEVEMFLKTLCKEAMEMKSRDISSTRKDFLQILIGIRNSEVEEISKTTAESYTKVKSPEEFAGPIFTENTMAGILSLFLSFGFEPVASTLTFCLYELALHPDIQDKIYNEIQMVRKENSDDDSYEDLKKFHYTEQVIKETLRKYPVGGFLLRYCTEPFIIPGSTVVIEKGVRVIIPIGSLHHDPQYFPEPDKFDPERFSEENVKKIVPGTYLPFGNGPRICIATRFALMDIKTMLITMVSNYTFQAYAKTQKNLGFDEDLIALSPGGEVWLRFKKRK